MKLKIFIIAAVFSLLGSTFASIPVDDKSYVAEYSKTPIKIYMLDSSGKQTLGIISKIEGNIVKFDIGDTGAGGTIDVPLNDAKTRFVFRGSEDVTAARNAIAAGRYDEAVASLRKVVYPMLPLLSSSERFSNVHPYAEMFIDALIKSKRFEEGKTFLKSLSLANLPSPVCKAALHYAKAVLFDKNYDDKNIKDIMDRLNFSGDNIDNIPDAIDVITVMREKGSYKDASILYTKLKNVENNPHKDEVTLWMSYCELMSGNRTTAMIYLDEFKNIDRKSDVFSLYKFIKGAINQKDKKYKESLDEFAEGIVYGDVASSWMPELLYNAGLIYKTTGKPAVSNEIFSQISLLYPDSKFAELSKKEFVDIKQKSE